MNHFGTLDILMKYSGILKILTLTQGNAVDSDSQQCPTGRDSDFFVFLCQNPPS